MTLLLISTTYSLIQQVIQIYPFFKYTATTVNEAWKYEKIYDSASVIKMEGFNNPFGSKERDIKLDHKKLTLEYALGKKIILWNFYMRQAYFAIKTHDLITNIV